MSNVSKHVYTAPRNPVWKNPQVTVTKGTEQHPGAAEKGDIVIRTCLNAALLFLSSPVPTSPQKKKVQKLSFWLVWRSLELLDSDILFSTNKH